MPLCLTLLEGERVRVGADVWVEVVRFRGKRRVTISFDAPDSVGVYREKSLIARDLEPEEELPGE